MTGSESRPVRLVVAGTAGGVGTTTVAALAFEALRRASTVGAPVLYDHSGGDLGLRLPNGDDVSAIDDSVAVHDVGAHAMRGGVEALASPWDLLVVVTASTVLGLEDADVVLGVAAARHGRSSSTRTMVVVDASSGTEVPRRDLDAFRVRHDHSSVLRLPPDRALAVGGRIVTSRLSPGTRRAVAELDRRTVGMLATQHRA